MGANYEEFERTLIDDGIKAVKRCIHRHDMLSAVAILRLCKAVAGDKFEVTIEKGDRT